MRSLVLLALVGLSFASLQSGWKDNTEYIYQVSGRSLTSLDQLSDQYSGVFLKAKLHVSPRQDGKLQARINDVQYAQIHSQLPDGWNSEVPEHQLSYQKMELSGKPFQIKSKDGLIQGLIVDETVPQWEINMIKSVVSQLQLDLHGKRVIESPINQMPSNNGLDGTFKTMEETVTGETETMYDIHHLPEYLIQSKPWMVPQHQLKGDGQVYEIIKTKNYTNEQEMPAFHYGFGELTGEEPVDNKMGKLLTRHSSARMVLTGKFNRYTIQSTQTVNKIYITPTLNSKEQGSAISAMNLTLFEVKNQAGQHVEISNPVEIKSLVYNFEDDFANEELTRDNLELDFSGESSEQTRNYKPMSMGIQKNNDHSGSSEEYVQQTRRPLSLRKSPLASFMHIRQTKADRLSIKENVLKIVRELSQELQQPEKILVQSSLDKFSILSTLIRLMSEEEISYVAQELYTQEQRGDSRTTWVVFRDAVAQAGTGPALLTIEDWIKNKKVEKEEAAELVSTLAQSTRVPSEQYVETFFELVRSSEVRNQQYLNETALLAFTRLINKVYIDKRMSQNQFPSYAFGSFSTQHGKEFVKETIIPYLAQKLEEAVSQADSRKIHTYIRALGNVGHKRIVEVFQPYLEGERRVSQFQRMLMVVSLNKLVESYPVIARSVLYKIYQNVAEVSEVRVAAVYQLMRTSPPVVMIQRMAENTRIDSQEEVNAAVKSAIENLSQLQSSESQVLRKAAESALPLLTRKQYGHKQSFNLLQDFIVKHMHVEFKQNMLVMGSSDSNLPKGIKYTLRQDINGLRQRIVAVQGMISSVRELTDFLYKQTETYKQARQQKSQEQSGTNFAEALNWDTTEREQLEGFFYSEMDALHKMWSFDNHTIKQLPELIREQEQKLRNGKHFQYTKLRQLNDMFLTLPTELGFPFLFIHDMPLLIQVQGDIKAYATPELSNGERIFKPEQINGEISAFVTIGAKTRSRLNVVSPFNQQIYTAGVDKNLQVHVPVRSNVVVDFQKGEAKIEGELIEIHEDARLLHYSSWPYTSRSHVRDFTPDALKPHTQHIKAEPSSQKTFDVTLGQKQGLGLRIWGHHPQQSFNLLELVALFKNGQVSAAMQKIWDESSLQQCEVSVRPITKKPAKFMIRLATDGKYVKEPQQQEPQQMLSIEELAAKVQGESQQRQQQLLKHVQSGIKSAWIRSIDAELQVEGDRKYRHVLTIAAAKSNVNPRSRIVAIYNQHHTEPTQYSFEVQANIPNTPVTMPFNKEPTAEYEVLLQNRRENEQSQIKAKIQMSRSQSRIEYLENNQPMSHVCRKEMQEGNKIMPACQNMTIESGFLDEVKVELRHENLSQQLKERIRTLFDITRINYFLNSEIRTVESEGNRIELKAEFQPETLQQVNITIIANGEETKFFNMTVGQLGKNLLVPHPVFHLKDRIKALYLRDHATLVIDDNVAHTFMNKSYPLSLGEQWTMVLQYIPQQARDQELREQSAQQLKVQYENFAIFVREQGQGRELRILLNSPSTEGKTIEINMKAREGSTPSVYVDGQSVSFDRYSSASLYNGFGEIYSIPEDFVKLEIQGAFYLTFDGKRVQIVPTSDKLRDSVIGLGGRFSNDEFEDFWTPHNCIVKSAKKFVESFNVEQSSKRPQDCIRKDLPVYAKVLDNKNFNEQSMGTQMRQRYVEKDGELCFTITPVPQCKSGARKSTYKYVPVYCMKGTKTAYYFKNQIDQGGNPDFSHKPETRTVRMEVAQTC